MMKEVLESRGAETFLKSPGEVEVAPDQVPGTKFDPLLCSRKATRARALLLSTSTYCPPQVQAWGHCMSLPWLPSQHSYLPIAQDQPHPSILSSVSLHLFIHPYLSIHDDEHLSVHPSVYPP